MNQALILDTETNKLNGRPIQIAYAPCSFEHGKLQFNMNAVFDQLYNCGEKIDFGAMSVHHIIQSDLTGKPPHTDFRLPDETIYLIGHNIQYDIEALVKCGVNAHYIKPICTLNLSRRVYPEAESHKLGALAYMLSKDHHATRDLLKNAHNAKTDIYITSLILLDIVQKLNIQDMEHLYEESCKALIPEFINFGKFKGTAIKNLPIDYVRWLQRQPDLNQHLAISLQNIHGVGA